MRKIWKALVLLVILALPAFLLTGCQNQAQKTQQVTIENFPTPQKQVQQQPPENNQAKVTPTQTTEKVNVQNSTNEDQELIELLNALDSNNTQ